MRLSDSPPLLDIQENKVFCGNGDVAFNYYVTLPEIYSFGEKGYDNLHGMWYTMSKNLPPHSIAVKHDVGIRDSFDLSDYPSDHFLQRAFKKHFEGRDYVYHYCVVSFVYTRRSILKNENIRTPFRKPYSIESIKKFDTEINNFNKEIQSVIEYVNGSGLVKLTEMPESDIEYFTENYYNGFQTDRICDTHRKGSVLEIGDREVGSFTINSAKRLSERVSSCVEDSRMSGAEYSFYKGFGESLTMHLPFNHVYTQAIYSADHYKLKSNINKTQKDFQGASGFDTTNEHAAAKLKEFEKEMADDEKIRLCYANFTITYFADKEYPSSYCKQKLSSVFKEMDIRPYVPSGKSLQNIFYNTFYCNISNLDISNVFVMDMQKAVCLFNSVTSYIDDAEGTYFGSRYNNVPVKRDVWDENKKRITARNYAIYAPTGSGKSVLANHLIMPSLFNGDNVVINDLGDSYQKLGLLFPKDKTKIVRFQSGKPLGINPFAIDPNSISTDTLNGLIEIIRIPWKGQGRLTQEEENGLRKILRTYYRNLPPNPSFNNFFEFVDYNVDEFKEELEVGEDIFNFSSFLHNCSEFASDGAYSFLFEDVENTDYSTDGKQLCIFEFSEAQDDPLLLSSVLLLSQTAIKKNILASRSKRGSVLYDEFGKQLKYPSILDSVAYGAQTYRKYEAQLGYILQQPSQLPQDEASRKSVNTILGNTSVIYCLKSDAGYDDHKEILKFNEHQIYQLQSLRNNFDGSPRYSEVYQQIGKFGNVVRVELPEEARCAYLTDGKDHTKIMELYEKTKDMEQAIYQFMNKNH